MKVVLFLKAAFFGWFYNQFEWNLRKRQFNPPVFFGKIRNVSTLTFQLKALGALSIFRKFSNRSKCYENFIENRQKAL